MHVTLRHLLQASRILADQSIGTPIHLSVVKINILEDDEVNKPELL